MKNLQGVDLMDVIASPRNLEAAWYKVREKGSQAGGDEVSIDEFEKHLWSHLRRIANELKSNQYIPRSIRFFHMEKDNGRTRLIGILSIQDKVVQRAFLNVFSPFYEKRFHPCSFGYRPGIGVDMAIQRVLDLYNQGYPWVLDGDIENFFDSIPQEPLKKILASDIKDRRVCRVINLWLITGTSQRIKKGKDRRGVLQGGVISSLMANIYLHRFDEEMIVRRRQLIRFGDDFVVMCRSIEQAQQCLQEVRQVLGKLQLRVNEQKTRIVKFDQGFTFLGKTILPQSKRKTGSLYQRTFHERRWELGRNL